MTDPELDAQQLEGPDMWLDLAVMAIVFVLLAAWSCLTRRKKI